MGKTDRFLADAAAASMRAAGCSQTTTTINQSLTIARPSSATHNQADSATHGRLLMIADSNSNIAWHRVQLRKNRDALKLMETSRFTIGETAGSVGETKRKIADLKRKIAESERSIAAHERQSRRPVATDLRSLSNVSWSSWNTYGVARR
jgi:hypothetical protein